MKNSSEHIKHTHLFLKKLYAAANGDLPPLALARFVLVVVVVVGLFSSRQITEG